MTNNSLSAALLLAFTLLFAACSGSGNQSGGDSSGDVSGQKDTALGQDLPGVDTQPNFDLGGVDSQPTSDTGTDLGGVDTSGLDTSGLDSGLEDSSKPTSPHAGAVVVTEIMYNPKSVGDEFGEYFELYNKGSSDIDLKGWTLYDAFNNLHTISATQSLILKAGSYLLLGRNGDVKLNGGALVDYVYDNFFLGNDDDSIILDDEQQRLVLNLNYGTTNGWPVKQDGKSIELKSVQDDFTDGNNWQAAINRYGIGDLGTPGGLNGYGPKPYTLDTTDLGWQDPQLKASLFFSYFEDPEAMILKALQGAKTSVHMAFFNIRLQKIIDQLGALKTAGVEVVILMDKKQMDKATNADTVQALKDAGVGPIPIVNANAAEATMHNKFTIIDGKRVLTGSANYSFNALNLSDEEIVLIDDASVAALYETEFTELKDDGADTPTTSTSSPLQVKFGPDDSLETVLLAQLKAATTSITMSMFALNQTNLIDELIAAHQRGVKVLVIADKVQADTRTDDEALDTAGITVLRFENLRDPDNLGLVEVHNKLLVIDDKQVIMGSANFTNLSMFHNDENLLILDSVELAAQANSNIALMLQGYVTNFNPTSVGWTAGSRKVTFKLRGLTADAEAKVYLVGDVAPLAEWNYTIAVEMTAVDTSNWTVDVDLPAGGEFEYRFFVRSKDQHNYTEEAKVRRYSVPYVATPPVLNDGFSKRLE